MCRTGRSAAPVWKRRFDHHEKYQLSRGSQLCLYTTVDMLGSLSQLTSITLELANPEIVFLFKEFRTNHHWTLWYWPEQFSPNHHRVLSELAGSYCCNRVCHSHYSTPPDTWYLVPVSIPVLVSAPAPPSTWPRLATIPVAHTRVSLFPEWQFMW